MSTSKRLKTLKRKLPVRLSEYVDGQDACTICGCYAAVFCTNSGTWYCARCETSRSIGVDNILAPGWDSGIEVVLASLDVKTLTIAYYEL
jgi:hypothetical protein